MLSLLDQGTATRDALRIAEDNERLGATLTTQAGLDRTAVFLGVVEDRCPASRKLVERCLDKASRPLRPGIEVRPGERA